MPLILLLIKFDSILVILVIIGFLVSLLAFLRYAKPILLGKGNDESEKEDLKPKQ